MHVNHRDFERRETSVSCFLKDESYDTWKYPRGIFARNDEFKIRVGPFFKAAEEILFSDPSFIKKIPVPDRPAFLVEKFGTELCFLDRPNESLPRTLSTDFSSFEASHVRLLYEHCEKLFYHHIFSQLIDRSYILSLIDDVIFNKNRLKFKNLMVMFDCLRLSGENNTSLGNGFVNRTVTKFNILDSGGKITFIIVEGDDAGVKYIGPIFSPDSYSRLGFIIKMKYVKHICYASFCGQLFDMESLTVVADPVKVVLNIGWLNVIYANSADSTLMSLMRTRGFSLVYQYSGCPIIQSLGVRILQLTAGSKCKIERTDAYHKELLIQALKNKGTVRPVSMSARLFFQEVFDISVVDQLSIEDEISRVMFGPFRLPTLEKYMDNIYFECWNTYVYSAPPQTKIYFGPEQIPKINNGRIVDLRRFF